MPLTSNLKAQLAIGPQTLFIATAAGTSLLRTLFPSTQFLPTGSSLPQPFSAKSDGTLNAVNLLNTSGAGPVVGAVWTPGPDWSQCLLEFTIDGAADLTATLEFGKLYLSGALATPLAQFTIKSATNPAGGFTVNPYTGLAVAGSNPLRTCDLEAATGINTKANLGQFLLNTVNAEDDYPAQIRLDLTEAPYYYLMVTNISTITKVIAMLTPLGD
jgi:hypothetical protein